jgi:FKBP-type peptidyl-prolyl cis-trans isomerase 2
MIQSGSKVKLNYTGKLENGEIFDTSMGEGRNPLEFTVGAGQLIKGFEDGIMGLSVGDKKTIHMTPEIAYGSVKEDLLFEVPKQNCPEGVSVGNTLQTVLQTGALATFTVTEVKNDTVVIDGNHPLAGKNLIFDVEILEIH